MTCVYDFFMKYRGISTNSWVSIAISVLHIKEAQQNGSDSAQSYPANNKRTGFDPESLRVITHVLSTTAHSLPWIREHSMGKGDGRNRLITGRWNDFYPHSSTPWEPIHVGKHMSHQRLPQRFAYSTPNPKTVWFDTRLISKCLLSCGGKVP